MYVSCQSRSEKRETLSAIERSIASGVKDKLIKKLGALYAGYIEIDAQIQYYFYIHDAEEFERGETIAEKTPLMDCTAGLADEPDWLTYKTLLYPDAAKLQTELNRDHIALMKKLNLQAYRFSVSWPRIIPKEGVVNEKGIRYYQNLVDEVLAQGMIPMVTLYHWDLPMWMHGKGGWYADEIADQFASYVEVVVDGTAWKERAERTDFTPDGWKNIICQR